MTEDEFMVIFNDCAGDVADRFYPKNDTAAQGGEPSGRRGEFLRDAGVLSFRLTEQLKEKRIIR